MPDSPNCQPQERLVALLDEQLRTQAASTLALAKECDRLREIALRLKNELTRTS